MMSELFKDWSTVVVPSSEWEATAKELLALAERPSEVRTTGQVGEFLISPEVAAKYTEPSEPKPRRTRAKKTEKEEPQ